VKPLSLATVLMGVLLSVLDFFIVNVALPSLQTDLGTSPALLQMIIAGYALAFASGMVTAGRLGDLFGRKKLYFLGMVLFTLASVACGWAPNSWFLLMARVVQGLAAAIMAPQVLALINTANEGQARVKAFAAYGVVMGVAAVFGQLAGGLLIQANLWGWGWRACFLINLPLGLATLIFGWRQIPESRAPGRPRFDFVGVFLLTAAVLAVVVPLVLGREGWPLWSWFCLASVLGWGPAFWYHEGSLKRRGGSPLLDPSLWKERAFSVGLATQLVFFLAQASYFLILALYLQQGLGLSPLQAGATFGVLGAGYLITSTLAPRGVAVWGRQTIALGGFLRLVGLGSQALGAFLVPGPGGLWWLLPGLLLDGAGQGFAISPLTSAVLSRIPREYAGSASGLLSTGTQVGNALGVAAIGLIFYPVAAATPTSLGAVHAFQWALLFPIASAGALILLVQALPGRKPVTVG